MPNPNFEKRLMGGVVKQWHEDNPDTYTVDITVLNHIAPAKWVDEHTSGKVTAEFLKSPPHKREVRMRWYFVEPKEAASFKMFFT